MGAVRVPTAHVLTYGCQMNEFDSESIIERLVQMGFGYSPDWKAADLLVFNTCAVRDKSAERVFGVLGHVKSLKAADPSKVVAAHGCMAAHEPDKLRERAPFVDILVDSNRIDDLVRAIEQAFPDLSERMGKPVESAEAPVPFPAETPWKRFLPIMQGCNFFCTFCIVPTVRGRERYYPPEAILERLAAFRDAGVREVTLLGQNVNSYECEGHGFPELLDRAALGFPDMKLRFTTSNPWDFSDRLVRVMRDRANVAKHLHLPVQSGSDAVLAEMNRSYTRDRYLAMVAEFRAALPDASLTTDLIAGFPGESEEDHRATLDLMDRVRFDSAFMFWFSPREGTPAADFPRQVPIEVRKRRLREIIDLQMVHSRERNVRLVGRVVPVLVEGPARRSPGCLAGRLDDNRTVVFPALPGLGGDPGSSTGLAGAGGPGIVPGEPGATGLEGGYVPVEITEADAFTLMGEARGPVVPPASAAVAIPVGPWSV